MSIEWEKSAALNGVSVEALKARFEKYPKSGKRVIAICEGKNCNNREREVEYKGYRNLCLSCSRGKYFEDPEAKEKSSLAAKKRFEDPEARKKSSLVAKKRFENPEARKKHALGQKKRYENPKAREKSSIAAKKRFENPEEREKSSIAQKKRYENHEEREKSSAGHQGIPYEDWTGYTSKDRSHLIPKYACVHLNSKIIGFNQHHIMSGVIISIPFDIHRSVYHRMPHDNREGKNMKEINELAYNYLMGNI